MRAWLAVAAVAVALAGCGGGGGGSGSGTSTSGNFTASSGVAQKGPLIKGSTVTAQELNSSLSPTGRQYTYQINSDLGTFSPSSIFGSQYIGLTAQGYYFDEVKNAISDSTITLNAVDDLSANGILNVNLLTTLAYQRIQNLVTKQGMTVSAAQTQAENEVLAALNIPNGSSYGNFGSLDLSKSGTGDQILAAVSSLFVYGNTSGQLAQLIANFQSDLADNGVIDSSATKAALAASAKSLNPTAVAANLTQEFSSQGVSITASNISNWIDQDGDGVIGNFKFQVPDAAPTSSYTFPAAVSAMLAGSTVSASVGEMTVNGSVVTSATIKSSDVLTVTPPAGAFPNGVLDIYLLSNGVNRARVSFVSGLQTITVTPTTKNLPKGLNQAFLATGTFSDGSSSDISNKVTWISSNPAVAAVNATSGQVTAVSLGTATLTATSGSVSSTATIQVAAATLQSMNIVLPGPMITNGSSPVAGGLGGTGAETGVGGNILLSASGTYSDGTTTDITQSVNWASMNSAIATVSATGLVTGVALGNTVISATLGSISNTSAMKVFSNAEAPLYVYPFPVMSAIPLSNGSELVLSNSVGFDNVTTNTGIVTGIKMPSGVTNISSPVQLSNGMVLMVGVSGSNGTNGFGYTDGIPIVYNIASNSWTATGSLPSGITGISSPTPLSNGMALAIGVDAAAGSGTPVLYNPNGNSWTTIGNLPSGITGISFPTPLSNGMALAVGSGNGSPILYNPIDNSWTTTKPLPSGVNGISDIAQLSNGMAVAEGYSAPGVSAHPVIIYNSTNNSWTLTGILPSGLTNISSPIQLSNGMMFAVGYSISPYPTFAGTGNSPIIYNSTSNSWVLTGSLPSGITSISSPVLLANDSVLAIGYSINIVNLNPAPTQGTLVVYNPATNAWSNTGISTGVNSWSGSAKFLFPLLNGSVLVPYPGGGDVQYWP